MIDNNKIADIIKQFRNSEQAIKSAEACEGDIALTAVNQARYAFYHLCVAMDASTGEAEAIKNYDQSLSHCKRSYYDACDAEMTFCIEEVDAFIKACHDKGLVVNEIVDGYAAKTQLLRDAKKFIEENQYNIRDRDKRYIEAGKFRDAIKSSIYRDLEAYYEIANEKLSALEALQKKSIRDGRWMKVGVLFGILGFVVAILK